MRPLPRTDPPRSRARRSGRPRVSDGAVDLDLAPREQILDAAARLFVAQGFARTSTREIAEMVGIRQASLYYHFAGKGEILAELLERSVRPTVDVIGKIERIETAGPAARLYLLALVDVRTLAAAPHNAGGLPRLPEVAGHEAAEQWRSSHDELTAAYSRLAAELAAPCSAATGTAYEGESASDLGRMLVQLVEVVVSMRANGTEIDDEIAAGIAHACLRVCSVDEPDAEAAAATAGELMEQFREL